MSTHRITCTAIAAGLAFLITAFPAAAKSTVKPAKPPKTHTVKVKAAKPQTAKAVHGPKSVTGGQVKAVKPTQATAKGQAKAHGPSAKTKTGSTDRKRASAGSATTDRKPAGTDRTQPNEPVELTKAQQLLMKNDNLRRKMQERLPPNTKLLAAASGFKNLGQFVAAVNVSHNQGIDFFALRALMVGPEAMSLGQAIQQLKGVDAMTARRIADQAAATADMDTNTVVAAGATNGTKRKSRK